MEKAIGTTLIVVGGMVAGIILNGLLLVVLWGWFVVPWFHIAPLTIPVALGLSLTLNSTIAKPDLTDTERKGDAKARLYKTITQSVTYPLLALGLGAIYHAFM